VTTANVYLAGGPRAAHAAINDLYRQTIKPHMLEGGAGVLTFASSDVVYRHQLRKHFHGPVLNEIAWQVMQWCPFQKRMVHWHPKVWKEHLRFLVPPSFDEVVDANGEVRMVECRSTERLADDAFAEFAQEATAYAATSLGVEFSEQFA
jgi:hypothetical protein